MPLHYIRYDGKWQGNANLSTTDYTASDVVG